jgi:outer membrane protein assembly factor BamB
MGRLLWSISNSESISLMPAPSVRTVRGGRALRKFGFLIFTRGPARPRSCVVRAVGVLRHDAFEVAVWLRGDVAGHAQGGAVKAFDPLSGREVWSWKTPHPMVTSILATAGGLIFTGEPSGDFDAFDANTGELSWRFQTGSGIHSNDDVSDAR